MWVPSKDVFPHRLAVQYITNERRSAQGDVVSIKSTPFETVLEDLYSGLRNPVYEAGIISSEYFFECAPLDLKPLVQILDGVEIRIILFLRRQDRIIESGYNQEVKAMGATATVAPPRYREYWDWLKLYEKWAEVFGNSNVKIINYDVAAKTGNVLPEYLQALNLPAELLSASDTNISDSEQSKLAREFAGVQTPVECCPVSWVGEMAVRCRCCRHACTGLSTFTGNRTSAFGFLRGEQQGVVEAAVWR